MNDNNTSILNLIQSIIYSNKSASTTSSNDQQTWSVPNQRTSTSSKVSNISGITVPSFKKKSLIIIKIDQILNRFKREKLKSRQRSSSI